VIQEVVVYSCVFAAAQKRKRRKAILNTSRENPKSQRLVLVIGHAHGATSMFLHRKMCASSVVKSSPGVSTPTLAVKLLLLTLAGGESLRKFVMAIGGARPVMLTTSLAEANALSAARPKVVVVGVMLAMSTSHQKIF
jgi:hypothetical protein